MNQVFKTLVLVAIAGVLVGCQPQAAVDTAASGEEQGSGGGHSHDHGDVGPHGGHLLHLEPSGVHAEWTHDDDSHTLAVYLDDFEAEKITEAKFVATVGEETEEFVLEPSGDGWAVVSEALMTHIDMGEAAEVCLVVVDDIGEHTCTIEAHEHHHH